ncbi:MAG: hypothetical protein FJX91_08420 [Bacteroidetes bacterium]|nr:hypothetical protein [Bacteroidota bacterium]
MMKKYPTLFRLLCLFLLVFGGQNSAIAQRINMIDIIGDVDSVTAAFTKSGLKLVAQNKEDYRLVGKMAGENIELRFYFTPVSRVVFKGIVITAKAYAPDSLDAEYLARVTKISKRYIIPETLIMADGSTVKFASKLPPAVAANPTASPIETIVNANNIPPSVQKIAWENMTYFTNLKLYCSKRADGKIITEYVVKDNEVRYNSEKAMLPGGGKDELGF